VVIELPTVSTTKIQHFFKPPNNFAGKLNLRLKKQLQTKKKNHTFAESFF
jgi:hypothetical protein